MKIRQLNMVKLLLNQANRYLIMSDLANDLDCSERTVRNDLNRIEAYLVEEKIEAKIERRSGMGVRLTISKKAMRQLMEVFFKSADESMYQTDQERQMDLTYQLLMTMKPLTLENLAQQFFVNKGIIKEDFAVVQTWLADFQLHLITKQKIGTVVEGTEKNKREALASVFKKLDQTSVNKINLMHYFHSSEVKLVNDAMDNLQDKERVQFYTESSRNLIIHILFMIKRIQLKQPISVSEKETQFVQGHVQIKWMTIIVEYLEARLNLHFPINERIYLALHLIGARMTSMDKEPIKLQVQRIEVSALLESLLAELTTEVEQLENRGLKMDTILSEGLKLHLATTFNRLESGLSLNNPLLQDIKKGYPYLFYTVMEVVTRFNKKHQLQIPEDEAAYIVVHFQAAIERSKAEREQDFHAVIVCHLGLGISGFLQAKIERYFPDIQIKQTLSISELTEYLTAHSVDVVLTTIDLPNLDAATIKLSPLLNKNEIREIEKFINQKSSQTANFERFDLLAFTNPFLLYLQQDFRTREEVLSFMTKKLTLQQLVEKEFIEAVLVRERSSSTSIGMGIAIPHGEQKWINTSSLSILTLKEPIRWGTEKVSLVFLLAIKKEDYQNYNMKHFFHAINQIMEDTDLLTQLIRETNKLAFLSNFNK